MATFVLVHGGRHGGWCWQRLARELAHAGHAVHTPTLTGLGERAHLLSPAVGLATHVADIVNIFAYEDLHDVVLVAHSYGGVVTAGAMESVHEQVSLLVLLDAHLPASGESVFDAVGPQRAAVMQEQCNSLGEGWFLPPSDASYWGLTDPVDLEWVNSKVTAQPIKTYSDPLPSSARARAHRSLFVECSQSTLPPPQLRWLRERSRVDRKHQRRILAAPHEAMITHPREVADLLLEAAAATESS